MEWEIHAVGDGEFLYHVLKGVAMLTGDGSFGAMISVGFMLAIFWIMFQGLLGGAREINIQHIIVSWVLFSAAFGTTADRVVVTDVQSGSMAGAPLEHVPLGVAATGGIISTMGVTITEMFEQAYSFPSHEEMRFSALREDGFLTPLEGVLRLRGLDFQGRGESAFHRSIAQYTQQCTNYAINNPNSNRTAEDILNTENVLSEEDGRSLKFDSRAHTTELLVPSDVDLAGDCSREGGNRVSCSCADGFDTLGNYWDEIEGSDGEVAETVNQILKGGQDYDMVAETIDGMVDAAGAHQNYLLHKIASSAITEGDLAFAHEHGDMAQATMIETARSQRDLSWALEDTMFRQIVTPLMTFMESAMYAVTPIVAFLLTFGQAGLSLFIKYLGFVAWTQLWLPTLSVINFFGQWAYRDAIAEKQAELGGGYALTSINGITELEEELQTWMGVTGMLAASTPVITLMLMTGAAVTATSLSQRFQSGSGDVAKDYGSAPVDVGAGQVSAGSHNVMRGDHGGFVEGRRQQVDATQGEINLGEQLQTSASELASRSQTMAESTAASYGQSFASSQDVADRFSVGSSREMAERGGYSQTEQMAMKRAEELGQEKGWTEQETRAFAAALTAGASASAGAPDGLKALTGLNAGMQAGGDLSSRAADQFQLSDGVRSTLREHFSEEGEYANEFSKVLSTAEKDSAERSGVFSDTAEERQQAQEQFQSAEELRTQAQTQRQQAESFGHEQTMTVPEAYGQIANNEGKAEAYRKFAMERAENLGNEQERQQLADMSQQGLADHYRETLIGGPESSENRGQFYSSMFHLAKGDLEGSTNLTDQNLDTGRVGETPSWEPMAQGEAQLEQQQSAIGQRREGVQEEAAGQRDAVGLDPAGATDVPQERPQRMAPDMDLMAGLTGYKQGDLRRRALEQGTAMAEGNDVGQSAERIQELSDGMGILPRVGDQVERQGLDRLQDLPADRMEEGRERHEKQLQDSGGEEITDSAELRERMNPQVAAEDSGSRSAPSTAGPVQEQPQQSAQPAAQGTDAAAEDSGSRSAPSAAEPVQEQPQQSAQPAAQGTDAAAEDSGSRSAPSAEKPIATLNELAQSQPQEAADKLLQMPPEEAAGLLDEMEPDQQHAIQEKMAGTDDGQAEEIRRRRMQ